MQHANRIAIALAGVLCVTLAVAAPPPSSARADRHASKPSLMQSGAMRDALSVAQQAFGFAASHPDASEAEKRSAANRMMQGIFRRELNGNTGNGQAGKSQASHSASPDVPMDAARRAGYEASRAFHEDPDSQETADAIRRLILTADGKLPADQQTPPKPAPDDDDDR